MLRIESAANQRDKAKRYSSDFYRLGLTIKNLGLLLAKFEPSERISFQVYIRNATEERIAQKLRWFDAACSTSLLRCLAGSPNNIFLSIRSGSFAWSRNRTAFGAWKDSGTSPQSFRNGHGLFASLWYCRTFWKNEFENSALGADLIVGSRSPG